MTIDSTQAAPSPVFYGNQYVTTTGSRGSRYLDVSNIIRPVTDVEPSLVVYSWRIDNRAETPVTTVGVGTYCVSVQFQFRYVFKQVVRKVFNKALSGDVMASGFDFTTSSTSSKAKAYPNPQELQVFRLPQILTDDAFIGGTRAWKIQSYDIQQSEDGINELVATLVASTHWMKYVSHSSKCVFPPLSSIALAQDFPI